MRRITSKARKDKRYDRKTYTREPRYRYCGSMFFWFYTIVHFSWFNCEVTKDGKPLRKKFDMEVLLALELVRFTTKYCEENDRMKRRPRKERPKDWHPQRYRKLSYRDLMLVRWLIFDKDSAWNDELREILNGTEYKYILDMEPTESYKNFFNPKDKEMERTRDKLIDNVNFKKYLSYLPKLMFLDCTAWTLNCDNHVLLDEEELRSIEILWYTWSEIRRHFRYALENFAYNPTKEEKLVGLTKLNAEEWISYYAEHKLQLYRWLEWETNKTKVEYDRVRNGNTEPRNDRWESVMECVLKKKREITSKNILKK